MVETGRHAQCHVHGQVVHRVPSMWQGQCDASDATEIPRLASQSPDRRRGPTIEAGPVPFPLEEFWKRTQMLKLDSPDDALVQGLRTRQILTTSDHWNILGWDHNAKCLKPTKQDRLSSTQLHEMLQRILQLTLRPEINHKFAAMKPLPKDSIPDDHQISMPWRLDLSMRSPESNEFHQLMTQLSGNGLTQLVAMRHRPTGLQRSLWQWR